MNSPTGSSPRQDPVIRLEDVSVVYRIPKERIISFKEYAIRWLKGQIAFDEFKALDGVSLDIQPGEVFGIIGPNGAGKSTLLKVLARVLRPSGGRVRVRGRVAPLLELGAGFDMELTGRENVFINGAILGQRREDIASRFDGLVDFAGLRSFIDMPLRTYSTGMVARLGFSVATDILPEVLVVDEVLSVGDAAFQKKAAARVAQFRDAGATIVLVAHDLDAVCRMCHRAAWLSGGRVKAVGPAKEVVHEYQRTVA
ncbi:MAG: ABC transporter ATP-binding protein [Elusimicrobiota bacterium]